MLLGGVSTLEYLNILYITQQLHARYGISEFFDIGARIETFKSMLNGDLQIMGFVTDVKYQLTKQPSLALGASLGAVRPIGGLSPALVLEASAYGSFKASFFIPYVAFRAGWNLSNMEVEKQLALGTVIEMGDLISLWLEATFVKDLLAVGGALSITLGK